MITEDYVSYEVAKLLKEKGFEGVCDYAYSNKGNYFEIDRSNFDEIYCLRPTLQMAMKWLREVHNIFIVIEPHAYDYINEKNSSYVFSLWHGDNYCENPLLKDFPSYEQACEEALKFSLENLI